MEINNLQPDYIEVPDSKTAAQNLYLAMTRLDCRGATVSAPTQ